MEELKNILFIFRYEGRFNILLWGIKRKEYFVRSLKLFQENVPKGHQLTNNQQPTTN
jgi:hypothetical protein